MRLLPGATIGILGGGQLGRMIAIEARRMGYRVVASDPEPECPARPFLDAYVQGAFGDRDAALEVARQSDVVTVETEHIPAEVLEAVEATGRLLRPGSGVLRTVQDRLRQKEFLARHGFPAPAFAAVDDDASLARAVETVGAPALLKTRRGGYDGKGQARVPSADEAARAWASLGRAPCILEAFVPFEREVSALLARGADGEVRHWSLAENVHRRGVLHTTVAPARVPDDVARRAHDLGARIAEALGHVGVLAVEMFLLSDGSLQVNELAPRVHNSGHWTWGASATSQFEQHARAVCGLPLGDPAQARPAAMLNLLGDLWSAGTPDWSAVFAVPEARLHLYGKKKAPPGRKMGHVVVLHEEADAALRLAEDVYAALGGR